MSTRSGVYDFFTIKILINYIFFRKYWKFLLNSWILYVYQLKIVYPLCSLFSMHKFSLIDWLGAFYLKPWRPKVWSKGPSNKFCSILFIWKEEAEKYNQDFTQHSIISLMCNEWYHTKFILVNKDKNCLG